MGHVVADQVRRTADSMTAGVARRKRVKEAGRVLPVVGSPAADLHLVVAR